MLTHTRSMLEVAPLRADMGEDRHGRSFEMELILGRGL